MFSFLKKFFGKNKEVQPSRQETLKEQPIVTARPEGLDRSSHAAAINEAKADVSKEENLTSTKDEDVTVEEFESPIISESSEDEPVYDIKKHPKGWQVILPGAQRAKRVLDTQQEAIEYCRENDYKFNVYKVDGTLKK